MLNDFMGILLIFLVCNFFGYSDLTRLLRAFVISQFFTIIFSVYSIVMYYFDGGIPQNINVLYFFNINLSEEFLDRATISNQIRLSLPYATPPHLSIIMAVTVCILIFKKDLFKIKSRIVLIILFSTILILTSSRTGIIAALIVIFFVSVLNFNWKIRILRSMTTVVALLLSAMFLTFSNTEYINKFINRFVIEDITQDRHILVPIEGIIIWLSSVKNFFIGIGYGSSINLVGKYTFLPPYFLNSFVTLVAEKGIVGLLLVIEYLRLLIRPLSSIRKKVFNNNDKAIYYSYFIVIVSFLFYEAKQNISVWIIVAIVLMLDISRRNNREEKS